MKKIIECPRCHLSVDAENDTCPFCTEDLTNVKLQSKGVSVTANSSNDISKGATEIVPAVTDLENEPVEAKAKKKIKLHKHTIFFLIGTALSLLVLVMFLLPGSGNANGSIYNFIFSKPTINGEAATIGTNAGTIAMLIEIIGLLCVAATLRSLQKKTAEVSLFTYFSVFCFLMLVIVSFASSSILSTGTGASTFTVGVGFILTGIVALAACVIFVLAVIFYKKYLVSNPLESFKA